MWDKFIHDKAVDVFEHLMNKVKMLKESNRQQDSVYKGQLRYMVRRVYRGKGDVCYLIFIVEEEQAPLCLASWEITAEFTDLNEELFYFIKSKMFLDRGTCWHSVPLRIGVGNFCKYDVRCERKDLSFLNRKNME